METKPPKCCHPDCENCPYNDCIYDGIEDDETKIIDDNVKRLAMIQRAAMNGTESIYKYNHSEKGKARMERYEQSEKRKESRKRYYQSEKGKEAQRRYRKSEKGRAKNAEKSRRYRERKKEISKWMEEVREYNKLHRYE